MITAILVDEHEMYRRGLTAVLRAEGHIDVLSSGATIGDVVGSPMLNRPDVLIIAANAPGLPGLEGLRELMRMVPGAAVLVLAAHPDAEQAFAAMQQGAAGYIRKEAAAAELVQACTALATGESFWDGRVMAAVLGNFDKLAHLAALTLTERELQVLSLIARGASNKQIAQALCLSYSHVGNTVSEILSKLQLADRTQAALYAVRRGITQRS